MRAMLLALSMMCLVAMPAHAQLLPADLVIDDFQDEIELTLDGRESGYYHSDLSDIGPLSSQRRLSVNVTSTGATGAYRIADSMLSASVLGVAPAESVPLWSDERLAWMQELGIDVSQLHVPTTKYALQFAGEYRFPANLDLVTSGLNAIAIDIQLADSSLRTFPWIAASITQTNENGGPRSGYDIYSLGNRISPADAPLTLLLPLDQFRTRSGEVNHAVFDGVMGFSFTITLVPTTEIPPAPDMTFSMQIDRIRFTTLAIPEPISLGLLTVGSLSIVSRRGYRSRCTH